MLISLNCDQPSNKYFHGMCKRNHDFKTDKTPQHLITRKTEPDFFCFKAEISLDHAAVKLHQIKELATIRDNLLAH